MIGPVIVVEKSGNSKTGPMSVTYAPQSTCPEYCPLLGQGCYGEYGYVRIQAQRMESWNITDHIQIAEIEADRIAGLLGLYPLRVHIVGDCKDAKSANIIGNAMREYEDFKGQAAWTYTHSWPEVEVGDWLGGMARASCESWDQVEEAQERGYLTCLVTDDMTGVVQCWKEVTGLQCVDCQQCRWETRPIGFTPHGTGARKVREVLETLRKENHESL
jgi:uncharacterized protein YraI